MSRRSGMKPVYIGDVGDCTIVRTELKPPPKGLDLDSMDIHQLAAVALECGFGLYDLIGIDNCYQHFSMVLVGGNPLPQGFNLIEHTNYCKNCFQIFRLKKLP